MTPEARLAAALPDDLAYWEDRIFHSPEDKSALAAAILAADPVLAADLALAAAVRRLGDSWWCDHSAPLIGVDVEWYDKFGGQHAGSGPTLLAAIEEALR